LISADCRIQEFIEAMQDKSIKEIVLFADKEATEAERNCYRFGETDCCRLYANKLKGLISFIRYSSYPQCCPDGIPEEEAHRLKHLVRISGILPGR
jgi:hypothetical protein